MRLATILLDFNIMAHIKRGDEKGSDNVLFESQFEIKLKIRNI